MIAGRLRRNAYKPGRILLEVTIAEKDLVISSRLDRAIVPLCKGDPYRLRQVLLNLASNAIKSTPQWEVTIECSLLESRDSSQVLRFRVRDTGIGIAPEHQDRLFRTFPQVDATTTRKYGGPGLGLATPRQLVELMGGEISVGSCPGRGSVFAFVLSLDRGTGVPVQEGREPQGEDALGGSLPGRVLLAEDNPINQVVAKRLLEGWGCRVECAANGSEAVEALVRGGYDLVLMDCRVPEMDGYTATRRIRQIEADREAAARVPIIALTANAMKGDSERCIAAGMDEFVPKPVKGSALRPVLARHLRGALAKG